LALIFKVTAHTRQEWRLDSTLTTSQPTPHILQRLLHNYPNRTHRRITQMRSRPDVIWH